MLKKLDKKKDAYNNDNARSKNAHHLNRNVKGKPSAYGLCTAYNAEWVHEFR